VKLTSQETRRSLIARTRTSRRIRFAEQEKLVAPSKQPERPTFVQLLKLFEDIDYEDLIVEGHQAPEHVEALRAIAAETLSANGVADDEISSFPWTKETIKKMKTIDEFNQPLTTDQMTKLARLSLFTEERPDDLVRFRNAKNIIKIAGAQIDEAAEAKAACNRIIKAARAQQDEADVEAAHEDQFSWLPRGFTAKVYRLSLRASEFMARFSRRGTVSRASRSSFFNESEWDTESSPTSRRTDESGYRWSDPTMTRLTDGSFFSWTQLEEELEDSDSVPPEWDEHYEHYYIGAENGRSPMWHTERV
jgi:hypothetical protein